MGKKRQKPKSHSTIPVPDDVGSVMRAPPELATSGDVPARPDPTSWIHRIPVWKEFGHWLKWASASATAATIAAGLGEYALALVLLLVCLACCIFQIWIWQTARHWVLKMLLVIVSIAIIVYGTMVVMDQKGKKRWGVLWSQQPAPSVVPPSREITPSVESMRNALRNDSSKPIRDVGFNIKLNRRYSIEELGHFRIIFEVFDNDSLDFYLGCQDRYAVNKSSDSTAKQYGYKCTAHYRKSKSSNELVAVPLYPANEQFTAVLGSSNTVEALEWKLDLYDQMPSYRTLEDLSRKYLYIFVSAPLTDKISEVSFSVNDWELVSAKRDILNFMADKPIARWFVPLTENEKSIEWRGVYLKVDADLTRRYGEMAAPFPLDFSMVHAKKVPEPKIVYDPYAPMRPSP